MKKISIFLIILIICFAYIPYIEGQEQAASIYLSPAVGTFHVGSTFSVSVLVNTGGHDINTINVSLKFDPQKLQVASPTAGKSFISVWIAQPSYSNITGTVNFQGGVPSPGINTSSGLVSTINFRVVAPGATAISVTENSKVLLNDGMGTDILSSLGRGVYNLILPPPEGPRVFSPTHPDENNWYKNTNLTLEWERDQNVTDFSYSIDKDFRGVPDNISEGEANSISYADLEDGIWYFHIKAEIGNVWGGITHFTIKIDSTPPAEFKLGFDPESASIISNAQPIISFVTTDALSGIDHYELKAISLDNAKAQETEFFVEVISPYRLSLAQGSHKIIVRAFDEAGNWQDSSEGVRVIPQGKFIISKQGINFWFFFVSWWLLILIIILLIIAISVLILLSRKYDLKTSIERENLKKVKNKADNHKEKIRKKYTA